MKILTTVRGLGRLVTLKIDAIEMWAAWEESGTVRKDLLFMSSPFSTSVFLYVNCTSEDIFFIIFAKREEITHKQKKEWH